MRKKKKAETIKDSIAVQLKDYILEHDLTYAETAKRINRSTALVHKILHGLANPSARTRRRIEEMLKAGM